MKVTELYVPVVTLSVNNNENHQKVFVKLDIYSNQILLELKQTLLVYSNNDDAKRFKTRRYFLPKGIIKNHNINGRNFDDEAIDSDIK